MQGLLTAVESRSRTDFDALEKRIEQGNRFVAEQHDSLKEFYVKALDTEHEHFSKLYSSHTTATNQLMTDLELRSLMAQNKNMDEMKELQDKAERSQERRIRDIERIAIESAAVLKNQQATDMQQLRDKFESMVGYIEQNMWWYVVDVLRSIFTNQHLRPHQVREIQDRMFNALLRNKVRAIEDRCESSIHRLQREVKQVKYTNQRSRSRSRGSDKKSDYKKDSRYYDRKDQYRR